MLHHSQQGFHGPAGCPPHKKIHSLWNRQDACSLFRSNGVKQRCCTILNKAFMGRQDAHPTRKFTLCGTGKMPVLYFDRMGLNRDVAPFSTRLLWAGRMPTPQENSLFVEQASCLFFIMVPLCEFNLP